MILVEYEANKLKDKKYIKVFEKLILHLIIHTTLSNLLSKL